MDPPQSMIHTKVTQRKTITRFQGSHMPRALKEMENAKGFFEKKIKETTKAHVTRLENRLRCRWKPPTLKKLVDELGGIVKYYGTTRTKEIRYTRTLAYCWSRVPQLQKKLLF